MAQELPSGDDTNVTPSRYSEQRAPQFTGGDVDPSTGNIVPTSKAQIASGSTAAAQQSLANATAAPADTSTPASAPAPATDNSFALPSTRLADMSATPQPALPQLTQAPSLTAPSSGSSLTSSLEAGLGSAAMSVGAKALGNYFSSPSSGGKNNGNPVDNPSNSGGTGNGGGSVNNAPLNLNPPGTNTGPTGSTAGLDNTTSNGGSSFSPAPAPEPTPAAPSGQWVPDYSKFSPGNYNNDGYMTSGGWTPYSSDAQRSAFASNRGGVGYEETPMVWQDSTSGSSFATSAPNTNDFSPESVASAYPSGYGGGLDYLSGGDQG